MFTRAVLRTADGFGNLVPEPPEDHKLIDYLNVCKVCKSRLPLSSAALVLMFLHRRSRKEQTRLRLVCLTKQDACFR